MLSEAHTKKVNKLGFVKIIKFCASRNTIEIAKRKLFGYSSYREWKVKVKVKSLSRVQLFATPWAVAYQAPPSMGFSRQEYWSGLPFPSPGDLPNLGIEPRSPALQADALPSDVQKNLFSYKEAFLGKQDDFWAGTKMAWESPDSETDSSPNQRLIWNFYSCKGMRLGCESLCMGLFPPVPK